MRAKLLIVAAMLGSALPAGAQSSDSFAANWTTTWTASPMAPGSATAPPRAFENQTIRHVVHVSVGGRRVRVRVSNAFGTAPLVLGAAHVALHGTGAAIVAGSDRALTFAGQSSITIPAGAVAISDAVSLAVPSAGDLAVSLYLPQNTGNATYHESSQQTSYIAAGTGDFTAAADLPGAETTVAHFFLSSVEVTPSNRVGLVVALGDSITEGHRSTVDTNRSWPELLSARLNPGGVPRLAVVNQGIGCSRLLHDVCGPGGAARFDRDVIAATGVTHVIVALGLNDIGLPTVVGIPSEIVSANDIIVGLRQAAARAHAQGLSVIGATLTPVGSSIFPGFFTPENEAKRQAVNQWIRTTHAFDGFIDFDAVVRDPTQPTRLLPDFASDDGVHPNDAGYQAMANAIPLSIF